MSLLVGVAISDEAEEHARLKLVRQQWFHIIFSSEELPRLGT